jgi:alkylresorcinol/alkylpyrone synthase
MARIAAIATANPAHVVDRELAERLLVRHAQRLRLNEARFLDILANTQIESRFSVLSGDQIDAPWSFKERNDRYIQECQSLGERVARAAIADAGLTPADIGSLISVSCTGYMIPAVDAYLFNRMGLRRDLRRTPITELGCMAGAVGLARAWEELQVYPDANVLLLSVELPSLTFQPNDARAAQIISSMIFTDGAAAVVVSNRRPDTRPWPRPSPRLLARRMYTIPDTLDDMGYNLDGDGLHIILSSAVPSLIQRTLPAEVDALLAAHSLTRSDLKWFAMHPAGPKVLALVEREFGLTSDQLAASWKVMRGYGNMSSAAVLFVLAEMLQNAPARPGDLGLIAAFGPGITGEILLARWED